MSTFSKPLDEITEADLQRLVEDNVEENRPLEYKRELACTGTAEKKEFVRDVVFDCVAQHCGRQVARSLLRCQLSAELVGQKKAI
jgi:hypothetical protein